MFHFINVFEWLFPVYLFFEAEQVMTKLKRAKNRKIEKSKKRQNDCREKNSKKYEELKMAEKNAKKRKNDAIIT